MKTEVIEVKTFYKDGKQRDIIQIECWFTALTFVRDAAQADLKCEVKSWEATV